jgi:hypothetical protein
MTRLESQIELLHEQYKHSKTINESRIILSSLNNLLTLYKEVTNENYLTNIEKENPYIYQKYVEYNNHKRNLFMNNFIKYRDFHYDFLIQIINDFDLLIDSEYVPLKNHSKEELEFILKNYSQSDYQIYQELFKDNRIFVVEDSIELAYTIFDYYNNVPFMQFNNDRPTIENVVTLIHEIGHVEDDQDLIKKIDYSHKSIFGEVNSLVKEKEFYDYLVENNIYKDEVKSEVLFEPDNIIESLFSLITYCKVPINYLNDFVYLKDIWKEEATKDIKNDELIMSIDSFEQLDFYDSVFYSYGNLLSTYFIDHKDKYQAFRKQRCNLFNPSLFNDLDISPKDVTKSLYKRYEKYY